MGHLGYKESLRFKF